MNSGKQKSDWKLFWSFIENRFIIAWNVPSYVLYFFIVILLIGTFGVLKEILDVEFCYSCGFEDAKVKSFSFNVSSTGLALLTASVIELIFISRGSIIEEIENPNSKSKTVDRLKMGIRMFGLSSLIVSFVIWILVNNMLVINWLKLVFSFVLLFFAYFIWWIANVKNKILINKDFDLLNSTIGPELKENKSGNPLTVPEQDEELNGNLDKFKK